MATSRLTKHASSMNTTHQKGTSFATNTRQACFTLKRPLLFQVRKSLVEYVDEDLLKMNTSVFYQRIFILAKNMDPERESALAAQTATASEKTTQFTVDGDMATLRTADVLAGEDEHYSQASTPDALPIKPEVPAEDDLERPTVRIQDPLGTEQEVVTRTFNFELDDDVQVEAEAEEAEPEPEPEVIEGPKDMYTLFTEKLLDLQTKCRHLSYTPDPMCGLLLYMNDYTMLMLESGEDMMGIFCTELLECADEFWQSNRVFMIEDHIHDLYTKDLLFRRIPAAFVNEKFPPSTPTDEHLMGKQHLIIREKLHTICGLIRESLEPRVTTESQGEPVDPTSDMEGAAEGSDEDHKRVTHISFKSNRMMTSVISSTFLPPDVFRRLLPEIQRIELVLASTRFYYTLAEFVDLYGKVPFGRDDDGFYWPIQNNYAPPNIFRRTPFDINLTFSEYAAAMKRRMEEEKEKHREELEAAAAAEKAAEEAQGQPPRPHVSQSKEAEEE